MVHGRWPMVSYLVVLSRLRFPRRRSRCSAAQGNAALSRRPINAAGARGSGTRQYVQSRRRRRHPKQTSPRRRCVLPASAGTSGIASILHLGRPDHREPEGPAAKSGSGRVGWRRFLQGHRPERLAADGVGGSVVRFGTDGAGFLWVNSEISTAYSANTY